MYSDLLGLYPETGYRNIRAVCLTLDGVACFDMDCTSFTFSPVLCGCFHFPTSSTGIYVCVCLCVYIYFSYCGCCEVVYFCGFDLHFPFQNLLFLLFLFLKYHISHLHHSQRLHAALNLQDVLIAFI